MNKTIHESVLKSIAFIEANLHNNIGVLDVANAVSYSQFYFSREFSKYAHISIYDYILRRKVSESYKDLFNSESKIVDLAFRYGFQSHEVYTRAFKKVFDENPSEAAEYKPLAIYEPIDEAYLDFLYDLKIDIIDTTIAGCFLEVDSVAEMNAESSTLVLLSKDNLLSYTSIIQGSLRYEESDFLSFKLSNLKHKIRIHHSHTTHSFRYFIDHFYDPKEISSNYILIKKEHDYIDIIVPNNLTVIKQSMR